MPSMFPFAVLATANVLAMSSKKVSNTVTLPIYELTPVVTLNTDAIKYMET